jgi:AAA ATPase domain
MIILRSLQLTKFKGIEDLTCDFNDLTVLVGLNNTGKTTVLQAIYLLVSSLPSVSQHADLAHQQIRARTVNMNPSITSLGLPGFDWLLQSAQTPFKITGNFYNGCTITIEMVEHGVFSFSVQAENTPPEHALLIPFVEPLKSITAEFFRPPGLLAPREPMLSGPDYRNQLSQGRGNQYWRNAIWWGVQKAGGSEGFEPVREIVKKHFPDISLQQPNLADTENPPSILITVLSATFSNSDCSYR